MHDVEDALDIMDITAIRQRIKARHYRITMHAQKRMDQRGITLAELNEAIYHGEVIETYPEDRPYPSCLIMGRVRGGFPLYVVCALERNVHIITVHWLDPEKWLDPRTRRDRR